MCVISPGGFMSPRIDGAPADTSESWVLCCDSDSALIASTTPGSGRGFTHFTMVGFGSGSGRLRWPSFSSQSSSESGPSMRQVVLQQRNMQPLRHGSPISASCGQVAFGSSSGAMNGGHVPTATKMRKVAHFRSIHLTFLKNFAFFWVPNLWKNFPESV